MHTEVIYGPPGTGKTSELLQRIKQNHDNKSPKSMCFVSFTRAAAKEMAHRAGLDDINISTIHSLAFRSLGLSRSQVMNRPEYKMFERMTGFEITGSNPEEQTTLGIGDVYLALYSLHKALLHQDPVHTYNNSSREGSPREFRFFVKKYEEFKRAYGKFDFTDMLTEALTSPKAEKPDFDVWYIDEAQDLSPLQWALIDFWCRGAQSVTVAGDDDQSIYVWGGADPQGMYTFEDKYKANKTILGQSFRIPERVHRVAEGVVANIKNRVKKQYRPRGQGGEVRRYDSEYSLPVPEHGQDVLFLYRNHSMREQFESIMIENQLPYVIDSGKYGYFNSPLARAARSLQMAVRDYQNVGRSFLKGADKKNLVRFCVGYEQMIHADDFSFVVKKPWYELLRGSYNMDLYENIKYLKAVQDKYGLFCQPTIHLSTIHGSKGREADRVVVLNGMGERSMENSLFDPDSELRNFYVAVTRAKQTLDIVYGQNALTAI